MSDLVVSRALLGMSRAAPTTMCRRERLHHGGAEKTDVPVTGSLPAHPRKASRRPCRWSGRDWTTMAKKRLFGSSVAWAPVGRKHLGRQGVPTRRTPICWQLYRSQRSSPLARSVPRSWHLAAVIRAQVRKHREYASMPLLVGRYIELHEDVADVGFDGALAQVKAMGDAGVG